MLCQHKYSQDVEWIEKYGLMIRECLDCFEYQAEFVNQ